MTPLEIENHVETNLDGAPSDVRLVARLTLLFESHFDEIGHPLTVAQRDSLAALRKAVAA